MNDFENGETKETTQGEARQHIEAVRGEIMQMGANDSENKTLDSIVEQMEDGKITPQQAVQLADGVRDSKQAYH